MIPTKEKYNGHLLTPEEYFSTWTKEEYDRVTPEIKKAIYVEYKTKYIVHNRDSFKCQVKDCDFEDSPITLHHYKHKRNGGKTSPRNCITICHAHHTGFNRGKIGLTFVEAEYLPLHISGHTQALDELHNAKPKSFFHDYKQFRKEMKEVRKANKHLWGIPLPADQIMLLINFLFNFQIKNIEKFIYN